MYATYFWPEYSGAALQALALARQLRRMGHTVEFVTVRWPGLPECEEIDGFPVQRLGYGIGKHREFRLWFELARFLWRRRRDFDIIHSHGAYYTNSIVGPLGRLAGLKSLVKASLANDDLKDLEIPLLGAIHRWLLSFVDRYVAISHDLLEEFRQGGFATTRLCYLPNGVDTVAYSPANTVERAALRLRLGLPVNRAVFLYVGVLDDRKNISWLAQRWVENDGFGTRSLLLAVGPQSRDDRSGSLLNSLRALNQSHPEQFQLRDFEPKINDYYRAADALILPSRREGLPNVVLEAMSAGIPCIAARVSGSRELIEDGYSGYTYALNDEVELAASVKTTLMQCSALGRNARKRIEELYSMEAIAKRYAALYAELCADRS